MNEIIANIRNTDPEQYLHVLMELLPGISLGIFTGLSMWWGCQYLATNGKAFLAAKNIKLPMLDYVLYALGKTFTFLFVVIAVYVSVQLMPYMESIDGEAHKVLNIFIILQCGAWLSHILKAWSGAYSVANRKKDPARVMMVETLLSRVAMLTILTLMIMFLLVNFGVDITAMLAGVGIGGLAIAFAFQNILKDIFSSFSIVFDKPFVIDDFITSNDVTGRVENIGMKTTRIRALSGEQVVVSNDDLLSSRIRNHGRMEERRVVFGFGVAYRTPVAQLEKIPAFVEGLIKKHGDKVRFDRCHLTGFGTHELRYETVYMVTTPNYGLMMDINQEVFLEIIRYFEKNHIAFGQPYQVQETLEATEIPGKDVAAPKKAKTKKA